MEWVLPLTNATLLNGRYVKWERSNVFRAVVVRLLTKHVVLRRTELRSYESDFRWPVALSYVARCDSTTSLTPTVSASALACTG